MINPDGASDFPVLKLNRQYYDCLIGLRSKQCMRMYLCFEGLNIIINTVGYLNAQILSPILMLPHILL